MVAATRTQSGQRLYSSHDVARLKLLRQLTQTGHAIGTIAALELEALRVLALGTTSTPSQSAVRAPFDAVVVGRAAANALHALPGCQVRAVYDDLDQAHAAAPSSGTIGVLLVRLASLQPSTVERVLALVAAVRAETSFVVYAFGTEASARSLGEAGVRVRREPIDEPEMLRWIGSAHEALRQLDSSEWSVAVTQGGGEIAPRAFSDEALARLAQLPSQVACECLRHMAEIVAELAGFERYSQDCASTGPADAALHRHLNRTAGVARTLFERALGRLLDDEDMEIPNDTGR